MFGDIWAEFSSWEFLSQFLVILVVVAPIAPYLHLVARRAVKHSEARLAAWSDYLQAQDELAASKARAREVCEQVEASVPVQDWCPKCNNIHVRKLMMWSPDGQWVCMYCAKGEPQPPQSMSPLVQRVVAAARDGSAAADAFLNIRQMYPQYFDDDDAPLLLRHYAKWQTRGTGEKI